MHSQPIFFGEADYERWLSSALEAERQRLKLQVIPNAPQPPAKENDQPHALSRGATR